MKKTNVIFLYAEITPYLDFALNFFLKQNNHVCINVIHFTQKNNLWLNSNESLYSRKCINDFKSNIDFLDFCKRLNPKAIFVSGRMNKKYLFIAKKLKKEVKIVTVQDTPIDSSLKQKIISFFSKQLYHNYFNEFWGVGTLQVAFALKIGFDIKKIHQGFYVCNEIFYKHEIQENENNYLKILYVGRLVEEKNILNLSRKIEEINIKTNSKHELLIIGDGILKEKLSKNKSCKILGVKGELEIIAIAKKCDLFCLPSLYEPWGVVIHEMSSLGLPILCSNNCGAGLDLVVNGYNGYKFEDLNEFEFYLNKFSELDKVERKKMSFNSKQISQKINHEMWNNTLNHIIS